MGLVGFWGTSSTSPYESGGTLQVGLVANGEFGGQGVTATYGVVFGKDKSTGEMTMKYFSVFGYGATSNLEPAASGGLEAAVSCNNYIQDLEGLAHTIGGSMDLKRIEVSGEVNIPINSEASPSLTIFGGGGVGGESIEGHHYITHTYVSDDFGDFTGHYEKFKTDLKDAYGVELEIPSDSFFSTMD